MLSFNSKHTRGITVEVFPVSLLLTLKRYLAITLSEKCPGAELFLVRIFRHSNRLRRFNVFSPNTEKMQTRRTSVFGHFTLCQGYNLLIIKKRKHAVFGQKPWGTRRQFNSQQTPCSSSERPFLVQFMSFVQGEFTQQISHSNLTVKTLEQGAFTLFHYLHCWVWTYISPVNCRKSCSKLIDNV